MGLNLKTISKIALLAVTALAFTACGEIKETDELSLTRGNVSIQSNGVYSDSNLNSKSVQVFISNLTQPGLYGSQFTADLIINGARKQITISTGNLQPADAGFMNTEFNAYSDARCTDTSCSLIGVVVWVGRADSPEWKQIGFLKVTSQNLIVAAIEKTDSPNRLYSTDQMTQELSAIYAAYLKQQQQKNN